MSRRLRQVALCDAHVAAEMPLFPRVASPVDVEDAEAFPEIARAIAGLADLSPERRAQLDAEWRDA